MKMWANLFYSANSIILVLLLLLIPVPNSFSQDTTKDLASEANKALRNSQQSMFNGKLDESQTLLNQASELVEKLKSVDPDYSQLKSLESKLAKQQSDLERRMPKKESQAPVPSPGAAAAAKAKITTGELPGAVSRRLGEIDKNITNIEKYLNPSGSMSRDVQLSELDRHLDAATSNMEQLEKYYGDKVSMDHPEIASRTDKLTALKNQVEQLQTSTRESATQAAADIASQTAQAQKLGKQINSLYDQYADSFEGMYGASLVYNASAEEAYAQLEKVKTIENQILPVLQPVLAEVATTYGTSAMEINNNLHKIGVPSSEQFGNDFERLAESVENVSKSRKATA
jgi:DNA repair exonuclease SbcCD ATPase subunit